MADDQMIGMLREVGLDTIGDIDSSLDDQFEITARFASEWIDRQFSALGKGISLFYLCYVLIAMQDSLETVTDYLESNNIGFPDERQGIAKKVITLYKRLSENSS